MSGLIWLACKMCWRIALMLLLRCDRYIQYLLKHHLFLFCYIMLLENAQCNRGENENWLFSYFQSFIKAFPCHLGIISVAFNKQIVHLCASVIFQTPRMAIAMLWQDWYASDGRLIHPHLDKMTGILRRHFHMYFHERQVLLFKFHWRFFPSVGQTISHPWIR